MRLSTTALRRGIRLIGAGAALATLGWGWFAHEALKRGLIQTGAYAEIQAPERLAPPSGVPELAKRVYLQFSEDRIPAVAAGVTFFFLLALFPAIACIVSLYGLFGDRGAILHELTTFGGFLPGGAISVMSEEVQRLTMQRPTALGVGFVLNLGFAVWSASGGIKALVDGLNIAYEVPETRGISRLSLLALGFTALVIVVIVGAVWLTIAIERPFEGLPLASSLRTGLRFLLWPTSYVLCTLSIGLVYRVAPDRTHVPWRWFSWGSATSAILWLAGTALFEWYVRNYGSYNRTYGTLGAAVGFLTWIWLSLVVLLIGAELDCELGRDDSSAPSTTTLPV